MMVRITIDKSFLTVLLLNLFTLGALFAYFSRVSPADTSSSHNRDISKTLITVPRSRVYTFDNPKQAHLLLQEFDQPKLLPKAYVRVLRKKLFKGIIRDHKYCEKSRKTFIEKAETYFLERNLFTDYPDTKFFMTTVLPLVAAEIQPEVRSEKAAKSTEGIFKLHPMISMYYIRRGLHSSYHLGKHFGCNHQIYNRVYGATQLNRKVNIALNNAKYFAQYKENPQCAEQFMPESYVLKDPIQCQSFFKYIDSEDYRIEKQKKSFIFFVKIGSNAHRGEGVYLFDEKEEQYMRSLHQNDSNCSQTMTKLILQKYIENPMLLYGHKFDFRVYMLIVSVNPFIVYYHDGFLKLSMHLYDKNSTDLGVHLSNTELSKKIFEQAKQPGGYLGMNETQIRKFQTWLYYRLQAYLLEKKYTTDPHWIENSMIPQIKKAMIHTVRMSKHGFLKRSQLYELFGCDFILDDNLKMWFIEANTSPMMEATTEEREKLLISMMVDHFELMYAYLRSRLKRIIQFINNLQKEILPGLLSSDPIYIPDLEKKKAEYNSINMNYIDPEFAVRPENGWKKIVDENLNDEGRYAGFIPKECF